MGQRLSTGTCSLDKKLIFFLTINISSIYIYLYRGDMRRLFFLPILVFVVLSKPSYAQEVSPIVTPEPTDFVTPTLLPTIIISSTPVAMQAYVVMPEEVVAGGSFELDVTLEHAPAASMFSVKVMIEQDNKVINRTRISETEEWIAWNASWDKFPIISTDNEGYGSIKVETSIPDYTTECVCTVMVRVRSESGKNQDFAAGTLKIVKGEEPVLAPSNKTQSEKDTNNSKVASKTVEIKEVLIGDAKKLPKETIVQIAGVITSSIEELGTNTFYVEDDSGGIKIVIKNAQGTLTRGMHVSLIGSIQEAYQEMYLKVAAWNDITFLGEGDLPDALAVPTGEINEVYEGRLVFINGQVTATSGNTFYVDDGTGPVKVYIKSSTNIEKPKMRTGYYSAITGIVSQYNNDYRIMPRFQHDVVVSTKPINPTILGALSVLPETGVAESKRVWFATILVVAGLVTRFVIAVLCLLYPRRQTSIS